MKYEQFKYLTLKNYIILNVNNFTGLNCLKLFYKTSNSLTFPGSPGLSSNLIKILKVHSVNPVIVSKYRPIMHLILFYFIKQGRVQKSID